MRTGVRVAAAGAALALIVAVLPQSYRVSETGQVVPCGTAFTPANPPPPPGSDDNCDVAHVSRWIIVLSILAAGVLFGTAAGAVAHRRRGRQSIPTA